MPQVPCITCGVLVPTGTSYCPRHVPDRITPGRGSGSTATKFRTAVLAKAGYRCEVVVDGVRCTATLHLEAHHVTGLREGGTNDPANGRAVCRRHHRMLERLPSQRP